MNRNSKSKFEKEISGWSNFVKDCKKQVAKDKRKFKETTYFPSAEICSKPKFCLIAMVPSLAKKDKIKQIEEKVKKGHKIFFPPIVSYCAWRYLCDEKYEFYITDLDKGVKNAKDAQNAKSEWHKNWLPLLKKELELLGNPTTISIGKDLHCWMCKNGLKADYEILHYSRRNVHLYKEHKSLNSLPTIKELKEYAKNTFKKFGDPKFYTEKQIEEELKRDFGNKRKLSKSEKTLLAFYRDKFTRIHEEIK